MCLNNINLKGIFFWCNFSGQNGQKTEKKFFEGKKMNSLEWL